MTICREGYAVNRDGLRLHYHDHETSAANAPTLICIPGLTRNLRDFESLAHLLSGRARVITLSLRGRGKSDPDPQSDRYIPTTYVGDVFDLMDHLHLHSAHFIGTSLGGIVTMLSAMAEPERVQSAVLNDIGPKIEDLGIERIQGYVGNLMHAKDWDSAIAKTKLLTSHVFPDFEYRDWDAFARQIYTEKEGQWVLDYDPAIADPFKAAPEHAAPDLWPVFGALDGKPVLAVRGGLSDLLSAETLDKMVEEHSDLTPVTVNRVGHAPLLTEPECLMAINAFYDRIT